MSQRSEKNKELFVWQTIPDTITGMEKEVIKEHDAIPYTIKRSKRAKYMRITVSQKGYCVLTLPWRAEEVWGERFIREKAEWIREKLSYFKTHVATKEETKEEYEKTKTQAYARVETIIARVNAHYGLRYESIAIRNQTTIWGSCSRKKKLSFNYKIAALSDHLAEYLVTHELCHLKEMNHSAKFWNLVAQTIPDYAARRRELKKKSPLLY